MSETKVGWDYGHDYPPSEWHRLPNFEGGQYPAPIPLTHADATENSSLGAVRPDYVDDDALEAAMKGFFFENLHFEIEIDHEKDAGGVWIGQTLHPLIKLHFHIPGEHTIDGKLPAMEVHLVHGPTDANNKGTAIGLVVEELTPEAEAAGHEASPLVQFFVKQLPKVTLPGAAATFSLTTPKSLNAGFPAQKTYFHYRGGLTTPPCSEPVFFYVLDRPIYTTKAIIDKFAGYVPGGNNRPLQDAGGRSVEYFPG